VENDQFLQQLNSASDALASLESILSREFSALQNQEFDVFQDLQPEKLSLLKLIQSFDQVKNEFLTFHSTRPDQPIELESLLSTNDSQKWMLFLERLRICDQLHRKVDFYLAQKIKTTNAILEILQVNKSHNATQLYDAYGNNKLSTIGNKISEA
jgi:flagellar biosynthesis/type III secretory pathway chaperone